MVSLASFNVHVCEYCGHASLASTQVWRQMNTFRHWTLAILNLTEDAVQAHGWVGVRMYEWKAIKGANYTTEGGTKTFKVKTSKFITFLLYNLLLQLTSAHTLQKAMPWSSNSSVGVSLRQARKLCCFKDTQPGNLSNSNGLRSDTSKLTGSWSSKCPICRFNALHEVGPGRPNQWGVFHSQTVSTTGTLISVWCVWSDWPPSRHTCSDPFYFLLLLTFYFSILHNVWVLCGYVCACVAVRVCNGCKWSWAPNEQWGTHLCTQMKEERFRIRMACRKNYWNTLPTV